MSVVKPCLANRPQAVSPALAVQGFNRKNIENPVALALVECIRKQNPDLRGSGLVGGSHRMELESSIVNRRGYFNPVLVLSRAAELRKQQENDSEDLAGGHGFFDAGRNRFLTGSGCQEKTRRYVISCALLAGFQCSPNGDRPVIL